MSPSTKALLPKRLAETKQHDAFSCSSCMTICKTLAKTKHTLLSMAVYWKGKYMAPKGAGPHPGLGRCWVVKTHSKRFPASTHHIIPGIAEKGEVSITCRQLGILGFHHHILHIVDNYLQHSVGRLCMCTGVQLFFDICLHPEVEKGCRQRSKKTWTPVHIHKP